MCDKNNPMIVLFGEGMVGVFNAHFEGEVIDREIAFTMNEEPREIGSSDPNTIGKTTEELGAFLRFQFLNIESARVVRDQVVELVEKWESYNESRRASERISTAP